MKEYVANERIIDKAVEIWKGLLKNPKFDNGDNTPTGGMASIMAKMIPGNADDENLEAFGKYLKESLMEEKYGGYLSVDYGPCEKLNSAAEKAGLKVQFPWKTNMNIWSDWLYLSYGYGAESVYYYPLPDGKWLVTKLSGSDIEKVKEYVLGGKPAFTVID
jgi:hypothetical protein